MHQFSHIRKFLIPAILVAGLLGIYSAFNAWRHDSLLDSGEQFTRIVSTNILTNWNTEYFLLVTSEAMQDSFESGGIELLINNFKNIGSVLTIGSAKRELLNPSWLPTSEPVRARFELEADFEKGHGVIIGEIIEQGNNWLLTRFYIQSPILAQ